MSQLIIVTTPQNSGDGTPLATAFNYTNSNFSELYARFQTTPPESLVGTTGDQPGFYASDATYFYYCFAEYDGSSVIWAQLTQVGNVSLPLIQNGDSNVSIAGSGANATISINGTSNVAVFAPTGEYVTGLISATGNIRGNYILGNGSQLTGLPATYTDANVSLLLSNFGPNTISSTGTIAAGNITGGNILTGGQVSAVGNINGNYILGNGSQLTGLPEIYGNANVAAFLGSYGSNTISTTGDISGGNLTAAGVVSVTGNIDGANVNTLGSVSAQGIVHATGNVVTDQYFVGNFFGNVTGNFVVPGSNTQVIFNTNGNADAVSGFTFDTAGPNLLTVLGTISSQGNVQGGNLRTSGQISATGNITGGNLSVTNIAGTLTTASQTNITAVGTLGSLAVTANVAGGNLTTTGQISSGGNITGGNISATNHTGTNVSVTGAVTSASVVGGVMTGTSLSVTGNITGASLIGTLVTASQPAITSVGTLTSLSATGNVQGGNLRTGGQVSAAGNIQGLNIRVTDVESGGNISTTNYTGTTLSVTGNITGGNIRTTGGFSITGNITTAGNISGGFILGNGSQLTGLPATYGNVNVAIFMSNFGTNSISTTGTVTSGSVAGNIITGGSMSATGNVTGGNLILSAGGDITTVFGSNGNVEIGPDGTGRLIVTSTTPAIFGNTLAVSGNITGGNILTSGQISATGNITCNTLITANTIVNSSISTTGSITGASLSVGAGSVTVGNIIATGNVAGNIGSISNQFNTVFAVATSAQYADLAEVYVADAEYAPGTVVVFGGEKEITVTNQPGDERVAGAISTDPAYLMNSGEQGLPVALRGKVPVKVIGPVEKGDSLVTSTIPGVAISVGRDRSYAQAVFAKALEANNDINEKVILAVII